MPETEQLRDILAAWALPDGTNLQERVERMIRPTLLAGHFGTSYTRLVAGLQYHLGADQDTRELAGLARLTPADHVLDVCCFIGGPALQIAEEVGCRVTGVDLDANAIAAASRIAQVAGFDNLLEFRVADAVSLPFPDHAFSVVWNQCSFLGAYEEWFKEFDRVLAPGGRLAFTFQRKGKDDCHWSLDEMKTLLEGLWYTIEHADDITQRDIEIGWKDLDAKLSRDQDMFSAVLGDEWIRNAHQSFATDLQNMSNGAFGNARIVASKPSTE